MFVVFDHLCSLYIDIKVLVHREQLTGWGMIYKDIFVLEGYLIILIDNNKLLIETDTRKFWHSDTRDF